MAIRNIEGKIKRDGEGFVTHFKFFCLWVYLIVDACTCDLIALDYVASVEPRHPNSIPDMVLLARFTFPPWFSATLMLFLVFHILQLKTQFLKAPKFQAAIKPTKDTNTPPKIPAPIFQSRRLENTDESVDVSSVGRAEEEAE
jgi:hypothetical protein